MKETRSSAQLCSQGRITAASLVVWVVMLLLSVPSRSQDQTAPSSQGFAAFESIVQNNIFNPNRSPSRRDQPPAPAPADSAPPESISLLGTMTFHGKRLAVFEGSSSSYRKVAKPSDQIAGFQLAEIHLDGVLLEAGSNTFNLPVGSQLVRRNDREWEQRAATGTSGSTTRSSTSPRPSSASSPEESSDAGNDVLKRLLEKRQQELNQ